jgi:hypothetical protein
MRISDIARIYFIDKILLRGRIKRTMEMIDMSMLMDDGTYRKLMSLEDVYDYQRRICMLCNKHKDYSDMLRHLLSVHEDYVRSKLVEVVS